MVYADPLQVAHVVVLTGDLGDVSFTVYGQGSELYDDPAAAEFFESGSQLLPWAADSEALVDRYDARLLLDSLPRSEERRCA